MDLQDDSALETMAQSAPFLSVAAGPSIVSTPNTPRSSLPGQKGFSKQIAQNAVEDKFLCENCNLILRHPLQSKCGHRFCRPCRDELSSQQQPIHCRACLAEGSSQEESVLDLESMFEDKAAIREMKKIPVKCINQGCTWKGSFLDYSEAHEFGCDKKLVECSLCGVSVSQAKVTHHETKQCPKRTVTCQHCKEDMIYEQQEKHLQASCPNLPIQCDKCRKQLPRSELKTHKEEDCPYRVIECPVPDCNTKLPLDQFPNHFMKTQHSTQKHMLYLFNKVERLEKIIAQREAEPAGAVGGLTHGAENGHDEAASADVNALATEDKQKLKLHEDLMAVLHGEILRCIKQVEALDARLGREGKSIKDGQKKIENIERLIDALEGRLQDVVNKQNLLPDHLGAASFPNPNEYGILTESADNTVTWRIDNFTQVRRAACNGIKPFIVSPSFSTGPCGYKMRIRFYADGEGTAKGKAFSAFIQLQKGPHDDLLPWPFTGKVYFMIVDVKEFKEHKVVSFSALPDQHAFIRPQSHMENAASGCLEFVNLKEFSERLDRHLVNDIVFMRVYVSLSESVNSRLQSLDLKHSVRR